MRIQQNERRNQKFKDLTKVSLFIKQYYCIIVSSVEKIQKVKIQKLQQQKMEE